MTQEIVINNKYGGFSISQKGVEWLRENDYEIGEKFTLPGEYYDDGSGPVDDIFDGYYGPHDLDRSDDGLVDLVKTLGNESFGHSAKLKIVEVPDGVSWTVEEREGNEWVAEEHRTWP